MSSAFKNIKMLFGNSNIDNLISYLKEIGIYARRKKYIIFPDNIFIFIF